MAINWGPWEGSGSQQMRVGIEIFWEEGDSTGDVTHTSAAARATVKYYTENSGGFSDDQKLNLGGAIDGFINFHNGAGTDPILRDTRSLRVDYGTCSYGDSPGSRTFSATLNGAYNGITPSKTVTSKIPARPFGAPLAPTNASVSRINDGSQKVTWTNRDTCGEPWGSVPVERQRISSSTTWVRVANPGGGAASYTDGGTVANAKYKYRVRSENGVGNSAWDETGFVWTSPAEPTNVDRANFNVADQRITWDTNVAYGEYQTEVWHAVDGVWDNNPLATLAAGTVAYVHSAPDPTKKHKYRVRTKTTSGAQLYSAYSATTTETLGQTTPPDAPTSLAPNGNVVDPTIATVLSWTYNSTDTTPQRQFEVQHRVSGATAWTSSGVITSGTTSWSLGANVYADGQTIEWRVRTWGTNTTASVWSVSATFQTALTPIPPDPIKIPLVLDLFTGKIEGSTAGHETRDYTQRVQAQLIGGGTRSVDASFGVSWSTRFIAISLGRSPVTFVSGFHDIVNPYGWSVTNKALTSNKATLTLNVATAPQHLRVGDMITISGVGAPFDGVATVREVTTTTVVYDLVAANVTSVAATGNVYATIRGHGGASNTVPTGGKITLTNWVALYYELPFGWGSGTTPRKNGVVSVTNRSLTSNVATLTVPAPHYFTVGDRVNVAIGNAVFDGEHTVTGVTATTITYAKTNANVTSAAASGTVAPTNKDTIFSNFHVVHYTGDYVVPSNWILIAIKNGDLGTVEWASGDIIDPGFDSSSPVLKQVILSSTTDVTANAGNTPPLRIGNILGTHMRIDGNEIQAMGGDAAVAGLILQQSGGTIKLGQDSKTFSKIDMGMNTQNTDANGRIQINHGLGVTPDVILVSNFIGGGQGGQVEPFSRGSTSFQCTCRTPAGATAASGQTRATFWIAIAF